MKIFNFAYVGSCTNDLSISYDAIPSNCTCDEKDLKKAFKLMRETLNKLFKETQKGTAKSYKNYKYGFVLTVIDTNKGKVRYKNFYINPLNIR